MSSTTLQYATSKDGTSIAYDRLGDGPAVVLVSGGVGGVGHWIPPVGTAASASM